MNTLQDYTVTTEDNTDELSGTIDSLFDFIVYRVPAKNETEIRMAALEAVSNFVARTGIWKKRYCFGHYKEGWYIVNNAQSDNILHVDEVVFTGQESTGEARPGIVEFGAVDYHNRRAHFGETGDLTRHIVYKSDTDGKLIFRLKHRDEVFTPFTELDIAPPLDGFGEAQDGVETALGCYQTGHVTCTLGMSFGSDKVPGWILRKYGEAIADGAAHVLTVGAQFAPTRWGIRYQATIEELIARVSQGGMYAPGTRSAIEGSVIL